MTDALHPDTVVFLDARALARTNLISAYVSDPATLNGKSVLPTEEQHFARTALIRQNPYLDLWKTIPEAAPTQKGTRTDVLGIPLTTTLQQDLIAVRAHTTKANGSSDYEASLARQIRLMESWRRTELHRRQRRFHHLLHYGEFLRGETRDASLWKNRLLHAYQKEPL